MKTFKHFIAACVVLTVFVAGCQVPVQPHFGKNASGRLAVGFGGVGGRTLLPNGPDGLPIGLTPDHYSLIATGPDGVALPEVVTTGSLVQLQDLQVGTWTLAAKAWSASNVLIGEGTATALVRKAAIESVQIIIDPLSGEGTLTLTFLNQLPAVLNDPVITVSFKKGEQAAVTPTPVRDAANLNKWTVTSTLPTGAYTVEVSVKQAGIPAWGLTETAYVYKGLTVTAQFAWTIDNVNQRPPVPTQLRVDNKDVDFVELRWKDDSTLETQYLVERRLSGETVWPTLPLAELGENVVTYKDTTVDEGLTYEYRITAKNYWGSQSSVDPLAVTIPAQIDVGGSISADTTWEKENIYFVYKNLTIKTGSTLTIEAGTKVRIGANATTGASYAFTVEGGLVAEGTTSSPVSLVSESTSSNPMMGTSNAGKISVKKTGSATLKHIAAPTVGLDVTGAFPVVSNAEFGEVSLTFAADNTDASKALDWSSNTFKALTIDVSATAALGTVKVQKSTVGSLKLNNYSSMILQLIDNDLGGVSTGSGMYGSATVKNTTLSENRIKKAFAVGPSTEDYGIRLYNVGNDSSMILENNVISGFQKGLYFNYVNDSESDTSHPVVVKGNTISGNSTGIHIEFPSYYSQGQIGYFFEANTITNNTKYGVEIHPWGTRDPTNQESDYGITFTDNYFYNPSADYEIHLFSSQNENLLEFEGVAVHAKNNVWWTDQANEISERIWDNGQDSNLMEVDILPITPLGGLQAKLLGPSAGAQWSSSANTFSWTIYGQATDSKLVLSEQADLSSPALVTGALSGTSHVLTSAEAASLVSGKTYYWRVVARDKNGAEYFSSVRDFTLTLPTPTLQEPTAGAILLDGRTPEFQWTSDQAAIRYHLIVSDSSNLSLVAHRVIDNDQIFGLSYLTPESLAPGTTYYWAVEALDANGLPGTRTTVRSFSVPEPGLALSLESAVAGSQNLTLGGELVLVRGDTLSLSASATKVPSEVTWSLNGETLAVTNGPQISQVLDVSPGRYTLDAVATIGGQTYSSSTKVRVVPNRFWAVSSSFSDDYRNAAVVNASGQVFIAGYNSMGQLGDPALSVNTSRYSSAQVAGLESVRSVSLTAYGGAMVLTKSGTVKYWGGDAYNGSSSPWAGDPNFTDPVSTPTLNANLTDIKQLSLGFNVGLALTSEGKVKAWGNDYYGVLGQGNYIGSANPPKLIPSLSSIIRVKVSGGYSYMMSPYRNFSYYPTAYALASDGRLFAWGYNSNGLLGNGTTVESTTPTPVPGLPTILTFDSALGHTVAIDKNGSVWTWGQNDLGQLGDGSLVASKVPIKLTGLPAARSTVVTGIASFVLDVDGKVWAWGRGEETGLGSNVAEKAPRQVLLPATVLKLFALNRGVVAQDSNNQLWFWGEDASGLFSKEITGTALLPVAIEGRF